MARPVESLPQTENTTPRFQQEHDRLPVCPACSDTLGTWGGPASLACGHNACLHCLQELQRHSAPPLCPLCRTPFDAGLTLGLNNDLRSALDRALALESVIRTAETEHQQLTAASSSQLDQNEHTKGSKFSIYDTPLPEVTGAWIPVSTPPTVEASHASIVETGHCNGDFYPDEYSWLGYACESNSAHELTAWSILIEMIAVLSGSQESRKESKKLVKANGGAYAGCEALEVDGTRKETMDPMAAASVSGQMEGHVRKLTTILASEPPLWLPDSSASVCMQCRWRFNPITCPRHHCRFCGGIFCSACSAGRSLLPLKFRERSPQRVCDCCYESLMPLQEILVKQVSHAAQPATHDVTDLSCLRAWINSPLGLSLEHEIYKATNTLRGFLEIGKNKPEHAIPEAVLNGVKGLAIITMLKMGMVVTYKVGTGLVIAKRDDGSWSAPSAIASWGIGWGAQAGGELTDLIIVLRNKAAVKAFGGRVHLSLGAGVSVAVGPMGRTIGADLLAGDGGTAACFTYSRSKGVFVGCSLEGGVVTTRAAENVQFYGNQNISAADILLGSIAQPLAAAPLYNALSDLLINAYG